jgi:hypothetical protein
VNFNLQLRLNSLQTFEFNPLYRSCVNVNHDIIILQVNLFTMNFRATYPESELFNTLASVTVVLSIKENYSQKPSLRTYCCSFEKFQVSFLLFYVSIYKLKILDGHYLHS